MAMESRSGGKLEKYGMKESCLRLHRTGFHPAVTSKTPKELQLSWSRMMKDYTAGSALGNLQNRPANPPGKAAQRAGNMTRAFLLLRQIPSERCLCFEADDRLARLIGFADIGVQILELVFAQGRRAVQRLATTSRQLWAVVAGSVKLWDFVAGNFAERGPAQVFIVVAPIYSPDELHQATGCRQNQFGSIWMQDDFENQPTEKPRKARNRGKPWNWEQSNNGSVVDPPVTFLLHRLRRMVKQIFTQKAAIKVLYFEKTPLLDRRLLSIIVRACHNLEMLAIYDCPLLHFGDVLCILDLVNEVNQSRREHQQPLIRAVDFFPRYHHRPLLADASIATYGLTWGPQKLDVVQRGFYFITMKAFMKARAMKLDLLFTEGSAFRNFLFKVPNYSLAVTSFLDALHRYVDLQQSTPGCSTLRVCKKRWTQQRRNIIYDLLKPVRLGLEHTMNDWPSWYENYMGTVFLFCSSCGYETLEDFFTAKDRTSRPHARTCASCIFQRRLDEEEDHFKVRKKDILSTLFPLWDGLAFNLDAPLNSAACGLVKLKSSVAKRNPPPPLSLNAEGNVWQPGYRMAMVRDNKVHWDSLQNLPTLQDLIQGQETEGRWKKALEQARDLDMHCLRRQRRRRKGAANEGSPGSMTHQDEERQMPRVAGRYPLSHDFGMVAEFEQALAIRGWV